MDRAVIFVSLLSLLLLQAEEKHAAAKADRAAAVLRASALAEWRRTACPPLFMG
jgi:hypothetical protein